MERLNKEAEAYKADVISQMEVLLNTLKSGNYETITEDFNLLTHRLNTLASHQYCNHSLLNAILHDKFLVAQSLDIRVSYNILLPERIDIPLNELASILFNLLDNAIEACQDSDADKRFIRLETKYVGKILSIHMENTKILRSSLKGRQPRPTLCHTDLVYPLLKILRLPIMDPAAGSTTETHLNLS